MKILLYVSIFLLAYTCAGCGLKLREDEIMGIRFSSTEDVDETFKINTPPLPKVRDPATWGPESETLK